MGTNQKCKSSSMIAFLFDVRTLGTIQIGTTVGDFFEIHPVLDKLMESCGNLLLRRNAFCTTLMWVCGTLVCPSECSSVLLFSVPVCPPSVRRPFPPCFMYLSHSCGSAEPVLIIGAATSRL